MKTRETYTLLLLDIIYVSYKNTYKQVYMNVYMEWDSSNKDFIITTAEFRIEGVFEF